MNQLTSKTMENNNDFEQPIEIKQYSVEHFQIDCPDAVHLTGELLQQAYQRWLSDLYDEHQADTYAGINGED